MSRLQRLRDIRVFRRIASARDHERAKDMHPPLRRVLRQVQRQRRKNWEQGSWASYRKVCQAVAARDAGSLTSIEFWAQRGPGSIWDND